MPSSPETVWRECLDIVRDNINRQSFKTWFEPLKAVHLEEEDAQTKLTVQLPSRFYYEWLEEHYFGLLRKTVTKVLGPTGRLYYDIVIEKDDASRGRPGASVRLPARPVSGETPSPRPSESTRPETSAPEAGAPEVSPKHRQTAPSSEPTPTPSRPQPASAGSRNAASPADGRANTRRAGSGDPAARNAAAGDAAEEAPEEPPSDAPVRNPFAIPGIQKAEVDSQLNNAYTFERFIEGDCNRLARSASWAIAQEPGATSFNPFLIYGGVGLGKTHLIQAIGNYAKAHRKIDTALYVSSERFTTEFVQAIQHNRISQFSMFYRQIDLLIVDDVQFFSGKEKTQEEFFHVFNELHQSGKQIVLSADRAPRDIHGIEERLLSRFGWGLSADVQPPELETRIAILQRKAEDDGIELPQAIIEFIAHNIKSNIRDLEGALIRLLAHATLHKRELDLPLAKEVLRDLVKDVRVNLTIEEIQRIVCEYLTIEEDLIRERTRKREVVRARQIAMYFCKDLTQHSLKTIGLHFGGRDHSTVIHANKTVEGYIETDPQFKNMVEEIRRTIDLRSR